MTLAPERPPAEQDSPYPFGVKPQPFLDVANDPVRLAALSDWLRGIGAEDEIYEPADLRLTLMRKAYTRERVIKHFIRFTNALKDRHNFQIQVAEGDVHEDSPFLTFRCLCGRPAGWHDAAEAQWYAQFPEADERNYAGWAAVRHTDYRDDERCTRSVIDTMEEGGWFTRPGQPGLPVDWEAFTLFRRPDAPRWLIPGIMERGELAALFGPPKSGKSLRALEWALHVAIRDGFDRVLYLDRENRPEETWQRLLAMGADPFGLGRLRYMPFPELYVDTDAGAERILELAENQKPDLIVFDSWARFFASGDQNTDGPANRAYASVLLPLRKLGIGVLRIDHTGHEGKRPSGTIVKLADIDHGWRLNAKGDEVTLTHTENRTGRGTDLIRERRLVSPTLRHVQLDASAPSVDEDEGPVDNAARLVVELDRLSVPLDWGRRRAKDALAAAGITARGVDLDEALRQRRLGS